MTDLQFLNDLEATIRKRLADKPDGSYTAQLAGQGLNKVAQKLGEEAVEVVLAAASEDDRRVTEEAADLLYHLLLTLTLRGLSLADVVAELASRHRSR
jgi:phosphoribosyl-ATP pyrophosphohydrolase